MTNGEKIQQDFECEVCEPIPEDDIIHVIFADKKDSAIGFDWSWWNAEYKEPSKSETKIDCDNADCNNCVNHDYCDYEKFDAVMDNMLKYPSTTKNGISNRTIIYKAKESKEIQEDLNKLSELNKPTTKNDCEHCAKTYGTLGCCDYVNNEPVYSCKEGHEEYARGLRKFGSTPKNDLGVDCISREQAINAVNIWSNSETILNLQQLPSVTSIRPKGHWIEEFNDIEGEVRFTCSNCRKYQLFGTDFCYHCGSDNRSEE